jgi:hypothetical protein
MSILLASSSLAFATDLSGLAHLKSDTVIRDPHWIGQNDLYATNDDVKFHIRHPNKLNSLWHLSASKDIRI